MSTQNYCWGKIAKTELNKNNICNGPGHTGGLKVAVKYNCMDLLKYLSAYEYK